MFCFAWSIREVCTLSLEYCEISRASSLLRIVKQNFSYLWKKRVLNTNFSHISVCSRLDNAKAGIVISPLTISKSKNWVNLCFCEEKKKKEKEEGLKWLIPGVEIPLYRKYLLPAWITVSKFCCVLSAYMSLGIRRGANILHLDVRISVCSYA